MFDTRLMFGASEAVGTFHRISQSVVRMMKRRGFKNVICYLDDFLIVEKNKAAMPISHGYTVSATIIFGLFNKLGQVCPASTGSYFSWHSNQLLFPHVIHPHGKITPN